MPRLAIPVSGSVAGLLKVRRKQLGLTLEEVSRKSAHEGEPIPVATLVRIEAGKTDPGLRRLVLLLRTYDLDPQIVADLVEREQLPGAAARVRDLEKALHRGIEFGKAGDYRRAMAHFAAIIDSAPANSRTSGQAGAAALVRQKAMLSYAIAARGLGRLSSAQRFVDDLLCAPPHRSLLVSALLVGASLWHLRGGSEVAIAYLRHAETCIGDDNRHEWPWVRHELARALLRGGRADEALRAVDESLAAYTAAGNPHDVCRASALRAEVLERLGRRDEALAIARDTATRAAALALPPTLSFARILEGRLLREAGRAREAIAPLTEAAASAVAAVLRDNEFFARYELWRTWSALGETERAALELEAAKYLVGFVEEKAPQVDEIRALKKTVPLRARRGRNGARPRLQNTRPR